MITVALPEHLDLVGRILQSGAMEGSWDPALREPGPFLDSLLAKIHCSLVDGFVRQIDPRIGKEIEIRIAGYVYCTAPGTPPIGFGLFKDFSPSGFELWLSGIDESWRGKGFGKALFTEILATPLGNRTELARCALTSKSARRASHILKMNGFATCRTTSSEELLLHSRTPTVVAQTFMRMGMPSFKTIPAHSAAGLAK